LFLPWIIYILVTIGPNILIYRSTLIVETSQDYVITGRAKGLKESNIYYKHILRNALIPVITTLMLQLPFLFTGSLLLENFFGIPGLGGLLFQSIQHSDYPVIKALTVIGSLLYIFFNLLADCLYALIDPRINLK
jgi:peptide/nickel transport system permease protein